MHPAILLSMRKMNEVTAVLPTLVSAITEKHNMNATAVRTVAGKGQAKKAPRVDPLDALCTNKPSGWWIGTFEP